MARPPKLTDKQRSEIQRKHVAGITTRVLAKEYKVSQATISACIAGRTEVVKTLAASIVRDERMLESLPVSDQMTVLSLADRLRGISDGLATAANNNANVAARLSAMADRKAALYELRDREAKQEELFKPKSNLRMITSLVDTATRASLIGTNLLNTNRNKTPEGSMTLEQLVMGEKVAS
jgi:hypothetical protein